MRWGIATSTLAAGLLVGASCGDVIGLDAQDPARGPGQLVGNGSPITDGNFRGGADEMPAPRDVEPPAAGLAIDCDADCQAYCDGLPLENPVNLGMCEVTWGVGLSTRPIERNQACRRLFADMLGRYPNVEELNTVCAAESWGETVKQVLADDDFIRVQQRRWADRLLYNNRAVNFERAFDMDELVGKAFEGRVAWDEFAAVTAAHPVIMRRLDTPADRAEFMFELFLGRPPYEGERSDLARLYRLWNNGYFDHPHVGRLPDSYIEYACVDEDGNRDTNTIGECTSVLWGHNELTLTPDTKRITKDGELEGLLWTGKLEPNEWKALQLPGRIIASEPAFWEFVVQDTLTRYLGYDLAIEAPAVRHELVRYLLGYEGDIRALHFAIATSFAYLQSSQGGSASERRWTYGPYKQIQVEGWLDSVKATTGYDLSRCDHRLPHPEDYLEENDEDNVEGLSGWAIALVRNTRWDVDDDLEVETDYRNLARTLGGCPSNEVGGRFTTVSVLNTAVQESFVAEVCGIGDARGVGIERLLPDGMEPGTVLDDAAAEAIVEHNQALFLGRVPTDEERDEARAAAGQCSPAPCDAEAFARPVCFAVLSSSEMLFY
ncbi:MAG: hypothetical protein AAGA54_01685 [Myxococcota bacterium]